MSAQHTLGPWFTKREGFSTVYVEARLRAGVIQEVAACGPTEAGSDQQEANAAFIVRACNSHDQLVAAAKAALDMIEAEVADGHYTKEAAQLRYALSVAGVEL